MKSDVETAVLTEMRRKEAWKLAKICDPINDRFSSLQGVTLQRHQLIRVT